MNEVIPRFISACLECPFGDRKENCPLKDKDSLDKLEKYRYCKTVSEKEQREIIQHCKHCVKQRENHENY